jgi:ATP-dependent DNA ligase
LGEIFSFWRAWTQLYEVVGWTDPEGSRPFLGALLLAYYDPEGRLVYAGRAGTGINTAELARLWRKLQPLATHRMPLEVPPPRSSRFGSPLVLSRVHWVRPELVAEVKFLTWTADNLLRQVVYEGLREDKPAAEVRRSPPNRKPSTPSSVTMTVDCGGRTLCRHRRRSLRSFDCLNLLFLVAYELSV